jgi:hypothetical protein
LGLGVGVAAGCAGRVAGDGVRVAADAVSLPGFAVSPGADAAMVSLPAAVGAAGAGALSAVATLPARASGEASRSPPQATASAQTRRLLQRAVGRRKAETSCQAEPIVLSSFP